MKASNPGGSERPRGSQDMPRAHRVVLTAALCASVLLVAGCNKLSYVGRLSQPATIAAIATVARPFTVDATGALQTTVRAGADVVLTGTNSENGPTDTGDPIITYTWTQQSGDTAQVDLVPRTTDTVSFTAPQVTTETQLHFQLTVTTANGATASASAVVTVEPVRDADHFLAFLGDDDVFTITAATAAVTPPNSQPNMPFTVTVTKLISFTDLNGVQHTQVPVGVPVTITSAWSAADGTGTNCGDPQNPQLTIPIPRLNLDDRLLNSDGTASATRLSDILETSDVDPAGPVGYEELGSPVQPAQVFAQISITTTVSGVSPMLCLNPQAPGVSPVGVPLVVARESLRAGAYSSSAATGDVALPTSPVTTLADTEASSQAYYSTIDPGQLRTTLAAWLQVNNFNPNVPGYGADAHAIYTNGFDLGLGRDMYMKASNCDASVASQLQASVPILQQPASVLPNLIGHCDVATVVINYESLQAASTGLNPIVAVAMEYSAVAPGSPRFVKFYVFGPNTNTGQLIRVKSVDLDHRGEKSVPGACVVCHGGVPATAAQLAAAAPNTYPSTNGTNPVNANGDVNATFLPWDLASFYYSDTDPGFSIQEQFAPQLAEYTRAKQEPQFKMLNAGAYLTLSNTNSDPARFALSRELIEGWYGGQGLPSSSFSDAFVPDGWKEGTNCTAGASCNPTTAQPVTGSQTIYNDIFSHYCRACHVAQVPGIGINLAGGQNHGSGSAACTSSAAATGQGSASGAQFPMGCYWQFINAGHLSQLVSGARMPFARRTMDRLWIDTGTWVNPVANGSDTRGAELIAHLNAHPVTPIAVTPGTPDITVTLPAGQDVLSSVPLTASDGFADDAVNAAQLIVEPVWQVYADVGASSCAGVTPLSAGITDIGVVGANLIPAAFTVPHAGCYLTELTSGGTSIASASLSIPPNPPQITTALLPNQVATAGTITLQAATPNTEPLARTGLITQGNGPFADYVWWVSNLVNLAASGASCIQQSSNCTVATPIALTETSQASLSMPPAATGSFTLNVVDADGHTASATQTVNFANLSANTLSSSVVANTPSQNAGVNLYQNNTVVTGDTLIAQVVTVAGSPPSITGVCASPCVLQTNTDNSGATPQPVIATIQISGSTLLYSPQSAWATNPPGGEITSVTKPPDFFYYQLVEEDAAHTVVNSTGPILVNLQVLSTVYWSNSNVSNDVVYNVFNRTTTYPSGNVSCIGCHVAGATNIFNGNTTATPLVDYQITGTFTQMNLYCELVSNISYCGTTPPMTPGTNPSGVFVDTANVLQSVLLRHPADLDNYVGGHTGLNRCPGGFGGTPPAPVTPSTCDLTNILLWIEDGANPF
jgi:hypothetical protein